MNVREALLQVLGIGPRTPGTRWAINILAPKIEEGLRATAREMAIEYGTWYHDEIELRDRIDKCVTVGITAMTEEL